MTILTEPIKWQRAPSRQRRIRDEQRLLTEAEQANVRTTLRLLRRAFGSRSALAAAMGMTPDALTKAKQPSRRLSTRVALATARIAGTTFDVVVSGAWLPPPRTCPRCHGTGHVVA